VRRTSTACQPGVHRGIDGCSQPLFAHRAQAARRPILSYQVDWIESVAPNSTVAPEPFLDRISFAPPARPFWKPQLKVKSGRRSSVSTRQSATRPGFRCVARSPDYRLCMQIARAGTQSPWKAACAGGAVAQPALGRRLAVTSTRKPRASAGRPGRCFTLECEQDLQFRAWTDLPLENLGFHSGKILTAQSCMHQNRFRKSTSI
jgi:hypothetical protein